MKFSRGTKDSHFGKNTPGGVINIKSRKAGDTHRSKFSASYASFNTQNYRVLADGPTGENSSYYFGLNRAESDGFPIILILKGMMLLQKVGMVDWDLTSLLKMDLKLDLEVLGKNSIWVLNHLFQEHLLEITKGSDFMIGIPAKMKQLKSNSNSQFLKLSVPTSFGNITSVTSRFDWEIDPSLVDLTFGDAQLANADLHAFGFISSTSKIIEDQERIAEELIFESDEDADWRWQLGLYFANDEIEGSAEEPFPTDLEDGKKIN